MKLFHTRTDGTTHSSSELDCVTQTAAALLDEQQGLVARVINTEGGIDIHATLGGSINEDINVQEVFTALGHDEELPPGPLELNISLETPNGSFAAARETVTTIEGLKEHVDIIFNERKRAALRETYGELYALLGNLRDIDFRTFEKTVAPYGVTKLSTPKADLFLLAEEEPQLIVFPEGLTKRQQRTLERLSYRGRGLLTGDDQNGVVDALFRHGLVEYNKERGRERLDNIEDDLLVAFGHQLLQESERRFYWNYGQLTGVSGHSHETPHQKERRTDRENANRFIKGEPKGMERYRVLAQYKGRTKVSDSLQRLLGGEWTKLRDVIYNNASPSKLDVKHRVQLLYSKDPADVLTRELLARVTPDDHTERFQHYQKGFTADYVAADESTRHAMLERVRKDVGEREVNAWLATR